MAIEQKVVIRVEIDPDMTKAAAVNAFLSALDKRLDKTNKKLNKTRDLLKDGVAFHLGRAARKMADFGKAILKVNFKGLIVELGLITIGLVAMKGALAAGRGIMRGWNSTVSFLKVTTAGFTASIVALVSALTAANRQFQQTQLSPFIGGMQNAREAMGALRSESLAPMGVQNVSGTAAMLSRAGIDTRKQAAIMREMANISSGDPKAFQAMSQAVATVQSSGSTKAGVDALKGLGPMFKNVAGQAGSMSAQEFMKALGSGGLTPEAFQGQMQRINETLMGGFKGMVTKLYVALADMGLPFLDPLRNALAQIEHIFLRTLFRVTGAIHAFGLETFVPKLISGVERFTNWWVKLIVNDLPRLMEVYGKIADWWRNFTAGTGQWFGRLGAGMDKFKESGEAAWEFWKNIFKEIGGFFGGRFNEYDKDIIKNRKEFEMFGTSLGRVIAGILGVVTAFKDEFMNMLPELNDFFAFLTLDVFPVMQDFAEQFAKAFKSALPVIRNIVSAFLPLLKLLNGLIGGLGEANMGLGVLFAGWLTMTQGGRGMMSATRGGFMGRAAPVGGQGAISHRMGQWAGGGQQAAAARGAAAASGGGFFATRAAANQPPAAPGTGPPRVWDPKTKSMVPNPAFGPTAAAAKNGWWQTTTAGKPGGMMQAMKGRMGMGTMIGGMMLAQLVGGMVGGDTGQTIANTGSMMAMGSMLGVPGMLAAGGLTLGKTAWDARTTGGGIGAGIGAGAMTGMAIGSIIPGVGTAVGLIVGGIIGGLTGGGLGGIKGHFNQKKLAESGRALASEIVVGLFGEIDKATSSDSISSIVKEYDTLLANDTVLTDLAKQEGVSKSAFKAELFAARNSLADRAAASIILIGQSVGTLAEMTGESALLIEENAERWGIALQLGGQAVDDYIAERNSGFKHTTAEQISSIMSGAQYDTVFNSPMQLEHRGNKMALETKAAASALFGSMQDTGDIDMDLLDAWNRAGMAELAATGMSIPDQIAAQGRVYANLGKNTGADGWDIDSPLIRKIQNDMGVTEGGTGKGFVDKTWEEFKKSNYYAQNLTERGGSMGYTADEIEAGQRKMYGASDGAEQMAIFNQMIWSKDADALIAHKNEVDLDTEALKAFRLQLMNGNLDLENYTFGYDGLRRLDNSRPLHDRVHEVERYAGASDEEILQLIEWGV